MITDLYFARVPPVGPNPGDLIELHVVRDAAAARHERHGRVELAAPIRRDGALAGCVYGSAPDGADVELLAELAELVAEEVARAASAPSPAERRHAAPPSRYKYEGIIGRSRPMLELYRLLDKVIESGSTVLIQGDNGTGKELVARAIHYNSSRAGERFVVQNCSAFNDNLLDSELFGHKKGSFTGAVADKQGLFEVADRGTFFLDEIGDMSPALQVKLLRVLQEGTFTPVGDTTTRQVDVRIIAATNRDLKKMVEKGQFREDLYYRVNVINVFLPSLRDRPGDIPILIDHFLKRSAKGRRLKQKRLTDECNAHLLQYPWPGNIRELENEIERLVVLSGDEKVIGEEFLSPRLRQGIVAVAVDGRAPSLNATIDALERKTIYDVLKRNDWNKTRAAEELRISRRNLLRKVTKYKLERRK